MPVHSPLLGQSLLLVVPPHNDMLKFNGSFPVCQVSGLCLERVADTSVGQTLQM